ncbi:MAG: hypothetical protein F6J93_17660 [Oscillatoria sp. SIO1A7]|nr:hypothetical protein [Oscillatoria sp. SIO1A7]
MAYSHELAAPTSQSRSLRDCPPGTLCAKSAGFANANALIFDFGEGIGQKTGFLADSTTPHTPHPKP